MSFKRTDTDGSEYLMSDWPISTQRRRASLDEEHDAPVSGREIGASAAAGLLPNASNVALRSGAQQ